MKCMHACWLRASLPARASLSEAWQRPGNLLLRALLPPPAQLGLRLH